MEHAGALNPLCRRGVVVATSEDGQKTVPGGICPFERIWCTPYDSVTGRSIEKTKIEEVIEPDFL
jgi:hypothetical protein